MGVAERSRKVKVTKSFTRGGHSGHGSAGDCLKRASRQRKNGRGPGQNSGEHHHSRDR